MRLPSYLCHRYEAFLRQKTCTLEAFSYDYAHIVPWLARLPQPFSDQLNHLHARFNACLKRNWLDYVIHEPPSAYERIVQATHQIAASTGKSVDQLVYMHHYHKSFIEPLELRIAHLDHFKVEWLGYPPEPDNYPRLWVGAHWGFSISGFAFIAAHRCKKVNAIATDALISDRVPPGFRMHIKNRYALLERHFCGGRVLFKEHGASEIATAFRAGEDMVVLFDLPASPTTTKAINLPFFGRTRAFAGGALSRAQRYGYLIQPYWVEYLGNDRVRIWCGEAQPAELGARLNNVLQTLLQQIERYPEKWLVPEQLPFFPIRS